MRCSRSDVPSPAFSQDEQGPPQEAVLKAISGQMPENVKSDCPILKAHPSKKKGEEKPKFKKVKARTQKAF
ncbi:hypothetical protein M5K25_000534 [Dendrobium thyrsiflorum]|uniref:Uncharacterized protein n=1 Tax=Dendrobium thyrsiflorum TaxID=117978 RepID=A0ABD0VVP2_DENTH